ncbi:MAG TPA: glycine/sarcosine/betaine reductase selenoprotein B family protein, partial [Candidatus Tectomicrobia bacterium]
MGTPLRVVHYLNQFFAGVGGEDMANIPPRLQEGSVGSGR